MVSIQFLQLSYLYAHPDSLVTKLAHIYTKRPSANRVLIFVADHEDSSALEDVNVECIKFETTLLVAFDLEEAAKYISEFRSWQGSGVNILTGYDKHKTHTEKAIELLASIPAITKNDAKKLLMRYGSVAGVITADPKEFEEIDGLGPKKVQVLRDTFSKSIKP